MYYYKQKLVRPVALLLALAMLLVALLILFRPGLVAAVQCPRDPDYAGAGSTDEPSAECARTPQYVFVNNASSALPAIEYHTKSSSGTDNTVSILFMMKGPDADPLVWEGRANYDNHIITIRINKADFSASSSGTRATRVDNGQESSIQIPFNDVARSFATEKGIAVNTGSGSLEADCKSTNINKDNCGIVAYLVGFIKFLSGLVGIVVVIMIALGGIQYTMAKDDPQAVSAAKERIKNALIALVAYLFLFSFLQWLVPGGIV